MFGGNGGLLGFSIGNPKYLGGPNGFEPPPLGSHGWLTKTLLTFLGMSSCKLTSYVPFWMCGLDMIPTTICTSANTNGSLVTIIINIGINT